MTFQKYTKLFKDRPDVPEVFFNSALVWEQAKDSRRMKRTFDEFIRKYGGIKEQGGRVVQIYSKLSDQLWDDLVTIKSKRQNPCAAPLDTVCQIEKQGRWGCRQNARRIPRAASCLRASKPAAKAHFRQLEAEFEEYAALDGVQAVRMLSKQKLQAKRSLSGRTTLRKSISISSSISTLIGR